MAKCNPPPYSTSPVGPTWKPAPGNEARVDTSSVPDWPGVRPFYAPDGQRVLTWLSKFDGHVFFNAGYSAGKGAEEAGVKKSPVDWKKDNEKTVSEIARLLETRNVGGKEGVPLLSSDWLVRSEHSKIKRIPQVQDIKGFATHVLTPTLEMFRGTWMAFELTAPFLRYCFPDLRQFWDGVMVKSHLGQMDFFPELIRIADQGRGDGCRTRSVTIDMDEGSRKREREEDAESAVVKRSTLDAMLDPDRWFKPGVDFDTAMKQLHHFVVTVHRDFCTNDNPEALAAVKRAEEAERTEKAKQDTIQRGIDSTLAMVKAVREMKAELKGLDVHFVAWRQLNFEWSLKAAAGACVYALHIDGYIKIGHTGNSLFERYKYDLWSHDMKELIILCMPHRNKKEAEQFEKLVQNQLKPVRCAVGNKREMFAADYVRVSNAFKEVYGEDDIRLV